MVYLVKYCDVLSGRGNGPNSHCGNMLYRKLLLENSDLYVSASDQLTKRMIVLKVIGEIHNKGGTFLKNKCGDWVHMDHNKLLKKIAQGLRDIQSDKTNKNKQMKMRTPTIIKKSEDFRNKYHAKSIANDVQSTKSGLQNMNVDKPSKSMVTMLNQNKKIYRTISSDQDADDTTTHDESLFKYAKSTCIAEPRINKEMSNHNIQTRNTRQKSILVEKSSFGTNIITPTDNVTQLSETIVPKDCNSKESVNNTQDKVKTNRNTDTSLCLLDRLTRSKTSTKRVFEIFAKNAGIELVTQKSGFTVKHFGDINALKVQRKRILKTNKEYSEIGPKSEYPSSSTDDIIFDEEDQFTQNHSKIAGYSNLQRKGPKHHHNSAVSSEVMKWKKSCRDLRELTQYQDYYTMDASEVTSVITSDSIPKTSAMHNNSISGDGARSTLVVKNKTSLPVTVRACTSPALPPPVSHISFSCEINELGSSVIEDDVDLNRFNDSLYLEKDSPKRPRGKDLGVYNIPRYNAIDTTPQDEKLPNAQNSNFQHSIGSFHTLDTFDNYV